MTILKERQTASAVPSRTAATRRSARSRLRVGLAFLVAGIALLAGGLLAGQVVPSVRVLLACVGLVFVFMGLGRSLRARFGPEFDLGLWVGVVWLVLIVVLAATADLLPLPESLDTSKTLTERTYASPSAAHWLGTDQYGLDILGQIIYGARVSLIVGGGGVLIGGTIGTVLGLLASFYRGRVDGALGWGADLMLSFPPLVLLMGLAVVLQPSTPNIALALGILVIPSFMRLSRATGLKVAEQPFVTMSRAIGASRTRIMFKEILPNIVPAVLSYAFLVVAILIVAEASLSFLGLSVQRPDPTWGNMIAEAEAKFQMYPFLLAPAVPLFLTVFSINRIGDHLRADKDR